MFMNNNEHGVKGITKLTMSKLNKETKNVKGRTRQAPQTMMFDKP